MPLPRSPPCVLLTLAGVFLLRRPFSLPKTRLAFQFLGKRFRRAGDNSTVFRDLRNLCIGTTMQDNSMHGELGRDSVSSPYMTIRGGSVTAKNLEYKQAKTRSRVRKRRHGACNTHPAGHPPGQQRRNARVARRASGQGSLHQRQVRASVVWAQACAWENVRAHLDQTAQAQEPRARQAASAERRHQDWERRQPRRIAIRNSVSDATRRGHSRLESFFARRRARCLKGTASCSGYDRVICRAGIRAEQVLWRESFRRGTRTMNRKIKEQERMARRDVERVRRVLKKGGVKVSDLLMLQRANARLLQIKTAEVKEPLDQPIADALESGVTPQGMVKVSLSVPRFVYHGTSEAAAANILREGITPRGDRAPNHPETPSHPECVYLTDAYALSYILDSLPEERFSRGAVLEVDLETLKPNLMPDEDAVHVGGDPRGVIE